MLDPVHLIPTTVGLLSNTLDIVSKLTGFFRRKNLKRQTLESKISELEYILYQTRRGELSFKDAWEEFSRKTFIYSPVYVEEGSKAIIQFFQHPEKYDVNCLDYASAIYNHPHLYKPVGARYPVFFPSIDEDKLLVGNIPNQVVTIIFNPGSHTLRHKKTSNQGFLKLSLEDQQYFSELYEQYVTYNRAVRNFDYSDFESFVYKLYNYRYRIILEQNPDAVLFEVTGNLDSTGKRKAMLRPKIIKL